MHTPHLATTAPPHHTSSLRRPRGALDLLRNPPGCPENARTPSGSIYVLSATRRLQAGGRKVTSSEWLFLTALRMLTEVVTFLVLSARGSWCTTHTGPSLYLDPVTNCCLFTAKFGHTVCTYYNTNTICRVSHFILRLQLRHMNLHQPCSRPANFAALTTTTCNFIQ